MSCPIRCYSCNKVIANKWIPYCKMLDEGILPKDAMDKLKLTRYCCRRMILTNVDFTED